MNRQTAALVEALKEEGHRLTTSRRIVLETLVESGGHMSADELASAVRRREGGVGRMTVYRTLDLLCDLGLARPVYQRAGAARFVLLEAGHHHHFVCSRCDHVYEFDDCLIEDNARSLSGRLGFDARSHLVEIYGICNRCQD
jgi:Fur family ferric uptake transcriptional regulator